MRTLLGFVLGLVIGMALVAGAVYAQGQGKAKGQQAKPAPSAALPVSCSRAPMVIINETSGAAEIRLNIAATSLEGLPAQGDVVGTHWLMEQNPDFFENFLFAENVKFLVVQVRATPVYPDWVVADLQLIMEQR